jgi:hypothetical protein
MMRGQSWPLPLLALFAFGLAPRLFTLALISGAIVLTGYLEWKFTGLPRSVLETGSRICFWWAWQEGLPAL